MPPFTYRLRFLIPRDRLPHTAQDEPHRIEVPPSDSVELHVRPGSASRPDNLILIRRGISTGGQALEQALAAKGALMRAGLISNVPMLLGNDASGTGLAPALIERVREETGLTPRPDVHGVDIIDEGDGPTFALRIEAEGRATTPIEMFLDQVADSLAASQPRFAPDDRLGLAIEVFMAASTERTPRTRFLGYVTVLEVLAQERTSSPEAVSVIEAALTLLEERGSQMDDAEVRSLRGSLGRLTSRSISGSVRDLAVGVDPDGIEGYRGGDVGALLGHCYSVRSKLVHDGVAPKGADIVKLSGHLFSLLRHILISRVDEVRGG